MILYVAGPYRAPTPAGVNKNIRKAREVAIALWRAGHVALCPHINSAHFEKHAPDVPQDAYLDGGLELLKRCDGIVLVEVWEHSAGAGSEDRLSHKYGRRSWHYPNLPPRPE